MKTLETTFLVLAIIIPSLFLLLLLANLDRVKKNKKARRRLLIAIICSFLINIGAYTVLKYTHENKLEESANAKKITKNENDNTTNEEEQAVESEMPKTIDTSINSENTTSKGYKIETKDGITYIDGFLLVNKTYPLPKDYLPKNTHKAVTSTTSICAECIDEEAYQAFVTMRNDATSQGLNIWIQSGYRSYNYQNGLYESYVKSSGKAAADTYSARAGHSEHQSGFAFDLNSITDAFASTKEGIWVNAHCYKYGFIIRYPKGKENETGYKYESWHLRYVGKELAKELYNGGNWITMEDHFGITSKYSE